MTDSVLAQRFADPALGEQSNSSAGCHRVSLRLAPCRHCPGSPAGLVRALGKQGWVVVVQKGSHAQLKHPSRGGRVTVPLHAGETIGPGLLRSILSQAGVTVEELRAVL